MTDVHDKKTRSYNMSQIKGRDTKPEILVRKFLFSKGFRYRLYDRKLPGTPDLVLPKYKTVIFVHGCFWHGHERCKFFLVPETRTDWWIEKINRNIENDKIAQDKLSIDGWRVIVLWECMLKPKTKVNTLTNLISELIG